MYKIQNNSFIVRFKSISTFTNYSNILKNMSFIKSSQNFMKKKITIDMDGFILLDYIDNISLLYRCIHNFGNTLGRINAMPSDLNLSELVIIYNKRYNKYIIFGLDFGKNRINLFELFKIKTGVNANNLLNNLQILYFLDDINDDIEKKINNDLYEHNISFITNRFPKNKFLPILVMKQKFSRYLSNVLYFILNNKDEISKLDYIIISKRGYNSNLIDIEYILGLKNYEIIGKKDPNGIKNGGHTISIIKDLFSKNDTGIKDLDLDGFYKNYEYILFNSKFLLNIIDKIQEKDILDLSIICSYYNQF